MGKALQLSCLLALGLCLVWTASTADEPAAPPGPIPGAIWAEDADEWVVEPFVGNNTAGAFLQGTALEAGFGERVYGMAFDKEGNAYIVTPSCVVRRDTEGSVRFLAGVPGVLGFRDGPAERALFSGIGTGGPSVVRVGPQGQIYVLDRGNFCIRQVIKRNGRWFVETVAGTPGKSEIKDGPALEASFGDPCNLAINSRGELVTFDNNRIRKIANGRVETVPVKEGVKFNLIMGAGCCFDDKDNLYVADRWNFAVRKVNLKTGEVEDVIGQAGKSGRVKDGPAAEARFHDSPGYVIFDPVWQCLYTNGVDENFVRRYKNGWISTLAGGGKWWFGPAKGANMGGANITAVDRLGNAYEIQGSFPGVVRKLRHVGKNMPQEGR